MDPTGADIIVTQGPQRGHSCRHTRGCIDQLDVEQNAFLRWIESPRIGWRWTTWPRTSNRDLFQIITILELVHTYILPTKVRELSASSTITIVILDQRPHEEARCRRSLDLDTHAPRVSIPPQPQ
jgi:hypothetical protein